jgi:mono/diheme cytochrome c family protein
MTPPETASVRKLGFVKRVVLVVVPATLAAFAWGTPTQFFPELRDGLNGTVAQVVHPPADGVRLFAQHCASCHGPQGEGDGIAHLTTKARYFGAEPFKFTSTTGTRIPTDADLVATLKRGIVGSSMPSFAQLRADELDALVGHVRVLTRQGLYAQLTRKAVKEFEDGGDEVDPVKVTVKADAQVHVGTPLSVPAAFKPTSPQSVAAGKVVFTGSCASCHGPAGRGDGPQTVDPKFVNDNGTKAVPRNLTAGVYKGGGEKANLYARLMIGIPGTPMPAGTTLTPEQLDDLLNYVLSMSPASTTVASGGR